MNESSDLSPAWGQWLPSLFVALMVVFLWKDIWRTLCAIWTLFGDAILLPRVALIPAIEGTSVTPMYAESIYSDHLPEHEPDAVDRLRCFPVERAIYYIDLPQSAEMSAVADRN